MKNTKLEKASILETESTGNGPKKTHKKIEIVPIRPTGPRTVRGKSKVRRNATKHGIFSEAILKGRESKSEYQALLAGLTGNFQPEGTMEELLVQKLCTLLWRQRRLLRAECAEIAKITDLMGEDTLGDQIFESEDRKKNSMDGILHRCRNPFVLEYAIEQLRLLRGFLEERGFDQVYGPRILERLYGFQSFEDMSAGIVLDYRIREIQCHPREEGAEPELDPEEAKTKMIKRIDWEIDHLGNLRKMSEDMENRRVQLQVEASVVPPPGVLDRLLRYEANLDRSFDRTLSQLERLQRIRLGQSVPPPVKIDLSH